MLAFLIVLTLIGMSPQPSASAGRFGPPQTMRCQWFSNFENSRFERCSVRGRPIVTDGAIPVFDNGVAATFDREARKLVVTPKGDVPWGTFEVVIVGRAGLIRREHSRYIGDTAQDVKVDRLISIRRIRGRD